MLSVRDDFTPPTAKPSSLAASTTKKPMELQISAIVTMMEREKAESLDLADYQLLLRIARSARGRLVLGRGGALSHILQKLKIFANNRETEHKEEEISIILTTLNIINICIKDEDAAAYIGYLGGHMTLSKLLSSEVEEISESAATAISSCHPHVGFPIRTQKPYVHYPEPLLYHFPTDPENICQLKSSFASIIESLKIDQSADEEAKGLEEVDAKEAEEEKKVDCGPVELVLRPVGSRMSGQVDTGYRMWGAAVVLARWLYRHRDLAAGKSILEIGCGLGLPGILCSFLTKSEVILTDYNEKVLENLEYNLSLNKAFINDELHRSQRHLKREEISALTSKEIAFYGTPLANCIIRKLDWDNLDQFHLDQEVDIIIASDMICQDSDAHGVVRTLQALLHEKNVAIFVLPSPRSRYGVEAFRPALRAASLHFFEKPVLALPRCEELMESVEGGTDVLYDLFIISKETSVVDKYKTFCL